MKGKESNLDNVVTLNLNKDFRRMYGKAKSFVCPALVVFALKNNAGFSRYGITAGKKIGNAVLRNRSRRVIRAAFFDVYPQISGNYDFVFVARGKTPYLKSQVVAEYIRSGLIKLGVIK